MATYQIQPGDNLGSIAQRYGTTVQALAAANGIANPNLIQAGATLNIPGSAPTISQAAPVVPTPAAVTPFSQVMPYDKLFNQNLVQGLIESQINPELYRLREQTFQNVDRNLGASGAFRTGIGRNYMQNQMDTIERQRKEQIGAGTSTMQNYLTDYYNKLQEQYYKNPSQFIAPKAQTAEDYLKMNPNIASAYKTQTSTPLTYQSPFKF